MKKPVYISTPIYYVNSQLHLGHAYSTLYAEYLANFYRQRHHPVIFVTGADQHGQKILLAAQAHNLKPGDFIRTQTQQIYQLWKTLEISYTHFVETHQLAHHQFVQEQFNKLLKQNTLKMRTYRGWYCVNCEMFVKQPTRTASSNICPTCQTPLTQTSENNYFFQVDNTSQNAICRQLAKWETTTPLIKYFADLTSFVRLANWDFSISRSSLKWGIPLLDQQNQTAYVWFDALFSYLSILQPAERKLIWQHDANSHIIHVLGKEISKFHLIYWPLLLAKTGFRWPDQFLIHGWLLNKTTKMSKSKGNTLMVMPYVNRYGLSVFRLFMASLMFPDRDIEIHDGVFEDFYTSHIVHNLSNYCYRVLKMVQKYRWIPPSKFQSKLNQPSQQLFDAFAKQFQAFNIGKALQLFFDYLDLANKHIEQQKPWQLAVANPVKLQNVLADLLLVIRNIPAFLQPIVPKLTSQFQHWLPNCNHQFTWQINQLQNLQLTKIAPLFTK